jgi:hypothetical protein
MITIDELKEGHILALSWKQPYAQLMLHGKIETRTWKTNYRGLVLICSSIKGYNSFQIEDISGNMNKIILAILRPDQDCAIPSPYPFGEAIAIGRLIDCRPMVRVDEFKTFVLYRPSLYCHIYEDVTAIKPIPFKGSQKWQKVSQDIINQIKFKS